MSYQAKGYWEDRLRSKFSLAGTGHLGFSERYNQYMYKLKEKALELALRRYCIGVEGEDVLDIGCGSGFFTGLYLRKGARRVTGIDITDVSVNTLRGKFPSCAFFRIDISESAAALEEKFDIINVFDVLYHITDDSAFERAVVNIGTWSKSGSWILISDTLDPSLSVAEHVRYRNEETYRAILGKSDIEIAGCIPIYNLMARSPVRDMKDGILKKALARAVESFAWLSYAIDSIYCPVEKSVMRLLICKKK